MSSGANCLSLGHIGFLLLLHAALPVNIKALFTIRSHSVRSLLFRFLKQEICAMRRDTPFLEFRRAALAALVTSGFACAPALAQSSSETITLTLDQATILSLPQNAMTVIIGNPGVADVTMIKKTNQMVLTPKAFGRTNMIALDRDGRSVGESTIRVVGPTTNLVVQRGVERESWDCSTRCNPVVSLGDSPRHVTETIGQAQARAGSMGAAK
jgi:hypothetical protein